MSISRFFKIFQDTKRFFKFSKFFDAPTVEKITKSWHLTAPEMQIEIWLRWPPGCRGVRHVTSWYQYTLSWETYLVHICISSQNWTRHSYEFCMCMYIYEQATYIHLHEKHYYPCTILRYGLLVVCCDLFDYPAILAKSTPDDAITTSIPSNRHHHTNDMFEPTSETGLHRRWVAHSHPLGQALN